MRAVLPIRCLWPPGSPNRRGGSMATRTRSFPRRSSRPRLKQIGAKITLDCWREPCSTDVSTCRSGRGSSRRGTSHRRALTGLESISAAGLTPAAPALLRNSSRSRQRYHFPDDLKNDHTQNIRGRLRCFCRHCYFPLAWQPHPANHATQRISPVSASPNETGVSRSDVDGQQDQHAGDSGKA